MTRMDLTEQEIKKLEKRMWKIGPIVRIFKVLLRFRKYRLARMYNKVIVDICNNSKMSLHRALWDRSIELWADVLIPRWREDVLRERPKMVPVYCDICNEKISEVQKFARREDAPVRIGEYYEIRNHFSFKHSVGDIDKERSLALKALDNALRIHSDD